MRSGSGRICTAFSAAGIRVGRGLGTVHNVDTGVVPAMCFPNKPIPRCLHTKCGRAKSIPVFTHRARWPPWSRAPPGPWRPPRTRCSVPTTRRSRHTAPWLLSNDAWGRPAWTPFLTPSLWGTATQHVILWPKPITASRAITESAEEPSFTCRLKGPEQMPAQARNRLSVRPTTRQIALLHDGGKSVINRPVPPSSPTRSVCDPETWACRRAPPAVNGFDQRPSK